MTGGSVEHAVQLLASVGGGDDRDDLAVCGEPVAQSIAGELPRDRALTHREHERAVLDAGGVVIRYRQLYGPGTYFETEQPPPPRIQVDDAARRTVQILDAPGGIVEPVV